MKALGHDACGADAVEYSLIAALIALGLAGGFGALAGLIAALWTLLGHAVNTARSDFPG